MKDSGVGPVVRTSRPCPVRQLDSVPRAGRVVLFSPDELGREAMADRLSRLLSYASWGSGEYVWSSDEHGTRFTVMLNPGQRDPSGAGRAIGFHLGFPPHRITLSVGQDFDS